MVLSNAERQRRFREKLKAAARSNPAAAEAEVLALRERNAWLETRVAELEALLAAPPAPMATTPPTPPTPANDPRQLDIETAIRTTTGDHQVNQVITTDDTTLARVRFGAAVRAARLALGWKNVKPQAEATGLAESTLRNIEWGRYSTKPENRARLIEALSLCEPI